MPAAKAPTKKASAKKAPTKKATAKKAPTTSAAASSSAASQLFWRLAFELQQEDPRVVEGTIMSGRCLRVGAEFLALCDFKDCGLVVKLPRARVDELIASGVGAPFAPAGKVFREWVSIATPAPKLWASLLREGVAFVAPR